MTYFSRRRKAIDSTIARADLTRTLGTLVGTLAEAHEMARGGSFGPDLARLVSRARRDLDAADEKLLIFDRRRQRSLFRRAGRIRDRLDTIHHRVSR